MVAGEGKGKNGYLWEGRGMTFHVGVFDDLTVKTITKNGNDRKR